MPFLNLSPFPLSDAFNEPSKLYVTLNKIKSYASTIRMFIKIDIIRSFKFSAVPGITTT